MCECVCANVLMCVCVCVFGLSSPSREHQRQRRFSRFFQCLHCLSLLADRLATAGAHRDTPRQKKREVQT